VTTFYRGSEKPGGSVTGTVVSQCPFGGEVPHQWHTEAKKVKRNYVARASGNAITVGD